MTPILELKNIKVQRKEKTILSEVNLVLNKGDFLYLIGQVGSGKSSLLKLLYAELPIVQGSAQVAGYNLNTINDKEIPFLRRKLGIVFQDFQLLTDRNVHDNLKFVLRATNWNDLERINIRIQEVLKYVGLQDKEQCMPYELSGGEQQRIAIARALLNEPEIIIADEPTGNLDPYISESIMNLLVELTKKGKTVIMATHNYGLIKKFFARIVKCDNGKLKEVKIKNVD